MRHLDGDPAARDAWVESVQLGRLLAHVLLDRIRVIDVAERDL
jgi:hypothetical protein